jgi:hypothetical protein
MGSWAQTLKGSEVETFRLAVLAVESRKLKS